MGREPAKKAREEGIINEFVEWRNQEQSADYELIARPTLPTRSCGPHEEFFGLSMLIF